MVDSNKKVAVVGGDGIGPEVVAEGIKVLKATELSLDFEYFDFGGARYLKDGTVLGESDISELSNFDAIYLGAVGHPDIKPGLIERGLLLKLRFALDLYINERPFVADGHDFVVVRENTEGAYAGEGGVLRKGTPAEVATQGSVNTRMGVERCIRYAFELAAKRRNHLTLVHKTNVLSFAGDLWNRTFHEVAADFPGVELDYNHVDAACIYFVEQPERYDVIVTDNLFGDILTDLGGAVSGGVGMAGSANLNPLGEGPSLFEPVHGSAPDIAGKGTADPRAAIVSAAMMLDFLGHTAEAEKISAAIKATVGVQGSTAEIGDAVAAALS